MDVDANAEQDDRFPLESKSGGFAERKWHVEKQETKELMGKISVKIFLFLKYFLLPVCLFGVFLCWETFWIYNVESAGSNMLLMLSGTQHSPLVVCRAVSKTVMKPLST